MFPVSLSLDGRRCLVVGGGGVALRKISSLLDAGARVTVVAPEVVPDVEVLASVGRLALERRAYRNGEAGEGYALVFAATDVREVNRRVFDDAQRANVFANVADDPELCSFHLPARVRRGPLEIAIGSGGLAPFLVGRLRRLLDGALGPEWGDWAASAAAFRQEVRASGASAADQERLFDRFVSETLDRARMTVQAPTEAERRGWLDEAAVAGGLSRSQKPGARSRVSRPPAGFVSLVGAGPGCAGLLTLRARDRLLRADAVVFDRLAEGALPADLDARVTLHPVGKEAGHHPVPQDQINDLLVRLAQDGKRVVRLKGGDPFVFGRGAEEAEALHRAGIAFEVVPGVTAGLGATAAAGIPVTSRDEAVQVTFVTAHECTKTGGPQVHWDLLARQPHGTLVGYMGVSAIAGVVQRLLAGGMDPATPAAMVEQGHTSAQRVVTTTLAELPKEAARSGICPPALFAIGPTVRHAETLDWWRARPMAGQRVAVGDDATGWREALEEAGAEVVAVPLPLTPAARIVLAARPLTGVVVRSPEEVAALDDACGDALRGGTCTAWCACDAALAAATVKGWASEAVDLMQPFSGGVGSRGAGVVKR